LDDFKADAALAGKFIWPKRLQDAPGLVAAYLDRPAATSLLLSIERTVPFLSGRIGFHGKDYMGLASVSGVRAGQLLAASEAVEDSVLVLVGSPDGAILVDYYRTPGRGPFSVAAQGVQLVEVLKACFGTI
jgi:hypothetical protein